MKLRTLAPFIIIGFIVNLAFHFIAIAAIDAPHNESYNVSCGTCHGQGLLNSPFWGGSMSYDGICTNCHKVSSCSYVDTNVLAVETHKDSSETPLAECRTCHDPHYQKQKNYKNTNAGDLYLATGTITNCSYEPPVPPDTVGISTLTYSSMTNKPRWDVAKLTGKTDTCRRTILFPNVKKLGYSFPLIGIDEGANTITVRGDARPVYQYITSSDFMVLYGQYIKDIINDRPVKFFDQTGPNSFADGDSPFDGVCEVCHTLTDHYRNDGGAPDQNHSNLGGSEDGTNCISCHNHIYGFFHGGGGGTGCIKCHGHDEGYEYSPGLFSQGKGTFASHSTHTENDSDDLKGPFIDCDVCHDINNFPYFADGATTLADTAVCNNCHSPNGSFDGVDDAVMGAKNNWSEGVYASSTLKAGKEKWCVSCHDDFPANSKKDGSGIDAPNVYLYYISGHGRTGADVECLDCHDAAFGHIDGEARTYAFDSAYFAPEQSGIEYAAGYRLRYVSGEVPLMIPANINTYEGIIIQDNAFRRCFICHDVSKILDDEPSDGTDTNFKICGDDPPRRYSWYPEYFNCQNAHIVHVIDFAAYSSFTVWDSDWDSSTGGGGNDVAGNDSFITCSSCHNVHGVAGTHGSTNEVMVRDGSLAGMDLYGFSYLVEDVASGGYPMVTSTGATQATSIGAVMRNMSTTVLGINACLWCHEHNDIPPDSSFNAEGTLIYTGVHIGGTSTTTLTVSGTPWGPGPYDPEVYWKKVRNITDGSSGLIRNNTQNTVKVPAGITGGTNNEWRTGDEAKIYDVPYLQWYRPWQNYK